MCPVLNYLLVTRFAARGACSCGQPKGSLSTTLHHDRPQSKLRHNEPVESNTRRNPAINTSGTSLLLFGASLLQCNLEPYRHVRCTEAHLLEERRGPKFQYSNILHGPCLQHVLSHTQPNRAPASCCRRHPKGMSSFEPCSLISGLAPADRPKPAPLHYSAAWKMHWANASGLGASAFQTSRSGLALMPVPPTSSTQPGNSMARQGFVAPVGLGIC